MLCRYVHACVHMGVEVRGHLKYSDACHFCLRLGSITCGLEYYQVSQAASPMALPVPASQLTTARFTRVIPHPTLLCGFCLKLARQELY